MRRIRTYLLLLLMLCVMPVMAQNGKVTIKGTVQDAIGPVIGATVFEAGNTSNGVITDVDGGYTITISRGSDLMFSCLGYADITEKVGNRTTVNVIMSESTQSLNAAEVVSVGYGSMARRDVTGSVGKVNMDDIVKSTTMNFDQAIAGRVAGVVVTTSDGAVGSEATITIRGNNSLTQSSAPLYVIDGFPTESSFATSLNPADIEAIDVLKDASATAIYGARGANGVIVITTKRGNQGKPKVAVSASWTGARVAKKQDLLDGYEFVRMHQEYVEHRSYSVSTNSFFYGYDEEGVIQPWRYSLADYEGVKSVDWQDMVYRNALTQNYNVSISGGSKDAGNIYNISFSALDQDGILINSNFNRYSAKINFTQDITKNISLDLIANYSRSTTNGSQPTASNSETVVTTYLLYSVWGFRPTRPLRYGPIDDNFINELVDEEVSTTDGFRFNPVASVNNEYRKRTIDYFNGSAALNYRIIPDLKLRISGGYSLNKVTNEQFMNSKTSTGHPASPLGWGVNGQIGWTEVTEWVNENTFTYDKAFANDHNLQVLGGVTFQGSNERYQAVKATHIKSESLGLEGMDTGEYQSVKPHRYQWTMMSGLARINYNYRHTYYATASFRADGSSKFPKANRWGFFPSASVAWTFSNEPWMKAGWFNNGKLRVSWGMTGNNRTTTPYDYYSQIATLGGNPESLDYVRDGVIVSGYYPDNMANPNLKWETTDQYDLGIDLAFLDNRLSLTGDVYLKNTRDLLLNATLPASSGYTEAMINVGSMRNKGLELTLNAVPVRIHDFEWNATVNFGMNLNTVVSLAMDQTTLQSKVSWNQTFFSQVPYVTKLNMPTGLMYGFIYEGTYKDSDFINSTSLKEGIPYLASVARANLRPGDPRYKDINGDGIVDDNDRTVIGIGQPLHTGGLNNTFSYKGIDLSIFFNWSYGNNILNANRLVFENYEGTQLNQFGSMRNAFSLSRNPDSDIPASGATGMNVFSSRVIEDGSFLRLKSITLGYTFPSKWIGKAKMSSARIYLTGENLFVLTNYSGADPEVSTKKSVLTPGFDWSAYPRAIQLTGGLSVTF